MKTKKIQIFVAPTITVSKIAVDYLRDYILQVTGQAPELTIAARVEDIKCNCLIIGNEKRNLLTRSMGFHHLFAPLKPDGYVLKTVSVNGYKAIMAAGKEEVGDKYAIYRLIREIRADKHNLSFGNYNIVANPFFKTREVIIGDSVPWDPFVPARTLRPAERCATWDIIFNTDACQINFSDSAKKTSRAHKSALRSILTNYAYENWSLEKLATYVKQLDCYGFNSLMFGDELESYAHSGGLITRRQHREKLLKMMSVAGELGNRRSLLIWGANALYHKPDTVIADWNSPLCDTRPLVSKSWNQNSHCWNDARGRAAIKRHLKYLSGYAPFIDHIISHFMDPGGCSKHGCTMATTMEIMNYEYKLFCQKNPNMSATFNLWPLTSEAYGYRKEDVFGLPVTLQRSWNGTYTWDNFIKNIALLAPAIMVANRKYDPEIAERCRCWKRGYGIWTWYNCDQEITASLHVEAERLGREFGCLPAAASEQVEYFSVPSNCHGLNSAGLYIAAALLWTPKRAPFEILKEFCRLVFGPKISDAVYLGYSAIARIRNHDVAGDSAFNDQYLGAGTADPAQDFRVASEACEALKPVTEDNGWVSKIPLVANRTELVEDLKDHLEMIRQYAKFRVKSERLAGKPRISKKDLAILPIVGKLKRSGGMIEWRKYRELVITLQKSK